MSSFAQFVRAGLDDADERIARRLPPDVIDHPWVRDSIGSGIVSGWIARAVAMARAACGSSIALAAVRTAQSAWAAAHWSARRRTIGLLLLTAVAVHAALMSWNGPPAGWIWTIVPGLTTALAVLLLIASVTPPRREQA